MRVLAVLARCVSIALTVVAGGAALPARAGSSLSEYLSKKIEEAHTATSQRQFELALNLYKQAMETAGGSGDNMRVLLNKRAEVYEQINMIDKAEADLTAAFKVEPFDPKVYTDRGYFYLRRTRYAEALGDFIAGTRYDPTRAQFYYGAARVLAASKDYGAAIKFYSEAMLRDPNDAVNYLGRAEAKVNLNMLREAQADYDQALKLGLSRKGDRLFAFAGRGYVSLALANYDDAIGDFDRALAIDSDAANALLWRAYAYERQGLRDQALRDYERAVAVTPENLAARNGVQRLRAAK